MPSVGPAIVNPGCERDQCSTRTRLKRPSRFHVVETLLFLDQGPLAVGPSCERWLQQPTGLANLRRPGDRLRRRGPGPTTL